MLFRYTLLILAFFAVSVHSVAQVPLITGNLTFITTRYSNFIGGFDEECSIIAPMVKLAPGENLCDLDTIQTNITGQVLITFIILNFGCFEEVAYENAIKLGAIALIDAVGIPPGSYESIHNAGQSFQKGDIPFLQVGTEFFGTFGIEGLSPAFNFLNGTPIVIQGCGDTNLFTAKKVKGSASSRPRIALIAYEALFLLFTAVVLFFGIELRQCKNLLDGSVISSRAKDVLGVLQIIGNVHGSLLNAIYWKALRKGCFLKDSKSAIYWRKEFFLSPLQIVSAASTLSLVIGLINAIDNFHAGKVEQFKRVLRFAVSLDIICGIVLFISVLQFILTLRKVLPNPNQQSKFVEEAGFIGNVKFVLETMKEVMKGKNFALRLTRQQTNNIATVNSKLINLSLHLSKWLTLYVIIMVLSSYCLFFGFLDNLPFGLFQNDPEMCKSISFLVAYVCIRIFTSYCKIIGLGGPSRIRNMETESTIKELNSTRLLNTLRSMSNLSSRDRALTPPRLTLPVTEQAMEHYMSKGSDINVKRTLDKNPEPVSMKTLLRPTLGRGVHKNGSSFFSLGRRSKKISLTTLGTPPLSPRGKKLWETVRERNNPPVNCKLNSCKDSMV
eukprot:snap_masked-scaffold_12-processed-gene-2.8-mRNA-1 protein AED:1.00 eAED:1.00 QI:0/0/0/0/1/1/2/0/611